MVRLSRTAALLLHTTRCVAAADTELQAWYNSAATQTGPAVEKWDQYFGLYERHLERFRGTDVAMAGDQASGEFWDRFVAEVPRLDVLIDDGGHTPEMQHATMERALPLLAPGGVYIIEDIHGAQNGFAREVFERFIDGFDGRRGRARSHVAAKKGTRSRSEA